MPKQVTADLHIHTTASDGQLTIDEIPAVAQEAGVTWIAVTDHDLIHPELNKPIAIHDGIHIIRGIELRVQAANQRIDLLGYGVEPTTDLRAELKRLQANGIKRAQEIIARVESYVGVDIDFNPQSVVGRPHIARAIDASEAPYDFDESFTELIGRDCPCYVARDITSIEDGINLLQDSCRVVGLAHPFRYDDPEAALELTAELDAVERYYPYGKEVDPTPINRAIKRNDLLVTGGSDAHKKELGKAGLCNSQFDTFYAKLDT